MQYSRDDSHYLLYLYDILRNQLIAEAQNTSHLLMKVYDRSTDLCKKVSIETFKEFGRFYGYGGRRELL